MGGAVPVRGYGENACAGGRPGPAEYEVVQDVHGVHGRGVDIASDVEAMLVPGGTTAYDMRRTFAIHLDPFIRILRFKLYGLGVAGLRDSSDWRVADVSGSSLPRVASCACRTAVSCSMASAVRPVAASRSASSRRMRNVLRSWAPSTRVYVMASWR